MAPNSPTPQFFRRDFLVGSVAGSVAVSTPSLVKRLLRPGLNMEEVNLSYAQSGEDVIAKLFFEELRVARPTYLDVGAFLPAFANNTYLFYREGSRGVLVEPNVDLVPDLRSRRPGDTVLNVGIGLTDQASAEYYRLSLPQWNTFDRQEAERRVQKTKGGVVLEGVVKMPLVPINRILAEHFPNGGPDFLSVDIESLDLAVLRTLDFTRFRPKMICTETLVHLTLAMGSETTPFLASHGYEVRGMTFANTLYVDSKLLA